MTTLKEFVDQFKFRPENIGKFGVEREIFLRSTVDGLVVPKAYEVYEALNREGLAAHFSPELSACQIESKTDPLFLSMLQIQLEHLDLELQRILAKLGLYGDYMELAPHDMPTVVFPNTRNRQVAERLSADQLLSACRVAATHIHVGMPDFETAICVYNQIIKNLEQLCGRGDFSSGERLRQYRLVAGEAYQGEIENREHFFEIAVKEGFAVEPRDWWAFIRISVHGTIEFRVFGSVDSIEKIMNWAAYCNYLCLSAQTAEMP